jgi:DNA-directed RNA polymerase specialized sigma24 family protein
VSDQVAADVVQEVFLTVFKRIKRFTKDGKPAAFRRWLYAIARYKVLQYWSDPEREFDGTGGCESWVKDVPGTGPSPDGSSEAGPGPVTKPDLRGVLGSIRPDWYAFWEHVVEGRSVEEVAKELDILPCAVDAAASRVLKHLCDVAEDGVQVRVLLLRRLLDLIKLEFKDHTFQAFWRVAADGRSAADVAEELGMSVPAVYTAKSRVLNRLREEAEALELYRAEEDGMTADVAVAVQREVTL